MSASASQAGRILLVEGNEINGTLVYNMLLASMRMDYETHLCRSLRDAVRYAQKIDYSAIVAAPELPDSGGMYTFHTLRETDPDSPIVVLMGLNDVDVGRRAVKEGKACACVEKDGLDVQQLWKAVSEAIETGRR